MNPAQKQQNGGSPPSKQQQPQNNQSHHPPPSRGMPPPPPNAAAMNAALMAYGWPPNAPMGVMGPPGQQQPLSQEQLLQLQRIRQEQLKQLQQKMTASQHQQIRPAQQQFPVQPYPRPPQNMSASAVAQRPAPQSAASSASAPASASVSTPAPKQIKRKSSSPDTNNKPSKQQVVKWLSQCDWRDKTIYVARQVLGGSNVNGFLKATASAQRIKRQRARQVSKTQGQNGTAAAAAAASNSQAPGAPPTDPQVEEEKLKQDVMNARVAKKIKDEMEAGVQWCVGLHATIRTILHQLEPHSMPPPLTWNRNTSVSYGPPPTHPRAGAMPASAARPIVAPPAAAGQGTVNAPTTTTTNSKKTKAPQHSKKAAAAPTTGSQQQQQKAPSTMSPGDPNGSTLRKLRKKKAGQPEQSFIPPEILEHDPVTKKRAFTKKQHLYRIFEVLRFRELFKGDYVAARVSSRDLWILARVVKPYPGMPVGPVEFLLLKQPKRDALFREKVLVKDVEENADKGPTLVPRHLVLPLARSFAEAADWGSRLKKGCRVYAMYPTTTSLYPATVIDNTTYCRGEDDIIVVEFDEDEKDASGALPKYHIPGRFVTLIPKEFPASQGETKKKSAPSTSSNPSTQQNAPSANRGNGNALGSVGSAPSQKPAIKATDSGSQDSTLDIINGEIDGDFDLGFDLDSSDFAMS